MSHPKSVSPTMSKVSALISRSIQTTSVELRPSQRATRDEVSALIVSSKRASRRLANAGWISLRCRTQSGPSFVTSPFPITWRSIR